MPNWLSAALLIALPCFLALAAYDSIAILALRRGEGLVPVHDLMRGLVLDLDLVLVYAVTVTPRILKTVVDYPARARRLCLIMLGLGLAWYEVICAATTRILAAPPDLSVTVVVLFVIPIILAPGYVRWLRTKIGEG